MSGDVLTAVLALVIGLLLGSVLPAVWLARRRGVDIRAVGDSNPGTVNSIRELGWTEGLITFAYDASVGVVAIEIAHALGVSEGASYAAGLMAVVGHRFPVYSKFRGGGQGMAASAGLLVYGVAVALGNGWLSALQLGILVAVGLVAFAATRTDTAAALVMLPTLVVMLALARPTWQFLAFMTAVAGYIWAVQVAYAREKTHPGVSRAAHRGTGD
jgi:acyl phosphate:glycerol-3-phosphate acyltransferase